MTDRNAVVEPTVLEDFIVEGYPFAASRRRLIAVPWKRRLHAVHGTRRLHPIPRVQRLFTVPAEP